MSPYLHAHALHQAHDPDTPWRDVLEVHLQHGVVHSSPSSFLIARPVSPSATNEQLLDLSHIALGSIAWHVWLAVGPIHEHLQQAQQYGAQLITFHRTRDNKPARRHPLARFSPLPISVQPSPLIQRAVPLPPR